METYSNRTYPVGSFSDEELDCESFPPLRDFAKAEKSTVPEAPLIENLLYRGETLVLSAPPKAGKTLLAIHLALCVSTGTSWLGLKTTRGAVLYLNLEVRERSFENRCAEIKEKTGLCPEDGMFLYQTPDSFICADIDEFLNCVYAALSSFGQEVSLLIVDPFYMIGDFDENSVQGVRRVLTSLRTIAQEFNVSIVVIHHHSKSDQSTRSLINRGSGSGAIGRFFGSIVDMMPVSFDRQTLEEQLKLTEPESFSELTDLELAEAREKRLEDAMGWSAWRIEAGNRDFSSLSPVGFWYAYPCFHLDLTGKLANARYARQKSESSSSKQDIDERLSNAMAELASQGIEAPTYVQLGEVLGVGRDQASKIVKEAKLFTAVKGEGREKVVVEVLDE